MFGVGAWDVDLEVGKILNAKFHHMGIILFPSWLYKMTLASKAIFFVSRYAQREWRVCLHFW